MVSGLIEEITDAESTETNRSEILSTMPETIGAQTIQRDAGGPGRIPPAEVLRSSLHGETSGERNQEQIHPFEKGNETQGKDMPEVRNEQSIEHTPHQWGRIGQLPGKLDDALRSMSHNLALGTWEETSYSPEEYVLRSMWTACYEIGYVPETLSAVSQVWESLNEQDKDWAVIRCATGNPWHSEWPDIPRVATGVKDRVNKLRALGNAVVPAQIYPIYKAIVESEAALVKAILGGKA
jgi:hypothetical protein